MHSTAMRGLVFSVICKGYETAYAYIYIFLGLSVAMRWWFNHASIVIDHVFFRTGEMSNSWRIHALVALGCSRRSYILLKVDGSCHFMCGWVLNATMLSCCGL